jgi:formylmethanofuran dehydrogenase subunit E
MTDERVHYHTNSIEYPLEHRAVHHDSNCHDGMRIRPEHRVSGTGGKPLCKQCAKRAALAQETKG